LARPNPGCGPITAGVRNTMRSRVPCSTSVDILEKSASSPLECQQKTGQASVYPNGLMTMTLWKMHEDLRRRGGRGAAPEAADSQTTVRCGVRPGGPGELNLIGLPMTAFAPPLSISQGRPVVDRTGLSGPDDIQLARADPLPGIWSRGPSPFPTAARRYLPP
jgi:hypothetical protein